MKPSKDIADRYDRVASSAPISADAARTFNMTGDHEPATFVPSHMDHWDAPPPTTPPPKGTEHRIGKRYGSLTVIGYLGSRGSRGSIWLMRCLCGQYESRRGKAVDRAASDDHCLRCKKMQYLQRTSKRQAYFDRYGKWPANENTSAEEGRTVNKLVPTAARP